MLSRLFRGGRRGKGARLVFIHVPKCGGSSLRNAIAAGYPRAERLKFTPKALRGSTDMTGEEPKRVRETVLLYFLAEDRYRFITGHVPFSEAAHRGFSDRWNFVTMLRDPVDRWFSAYFYKRHRPDHPFKIEEELASYVDSEPAVDLGRKLVRVFCGDVDERADEPAAVERAKENLERLTLVGALGHLDRFVARYREKVGTNLRITRRNESPLSRERREAQITPEIRKKVQRLCRPDLEVYRHAVDHLL